MAFSRINDEDHEANGRKQWMYVHSYLGEIGPKLATLVIDSTEVTKCFTIPLAQLQTPRQWTVREYSAPFFTPIAPLEEGVIWGMT